MRVRNPTPALFGWCVCPAIALFVSGTSPAYAACNLSPTAGNSVYICDSGASGGLLDTNGSNTLTMPAPGGVITGNVTFGGGIDTVNVDAGSISGTVFQGGGLDVFIITGGQIGALQQGADRDTATISGGRIVGTFSDGDIVTMTGGRIGTVDLLIGNNEMRMSGGSIDASIIAGANNDFIEISGTASVGTFINTGSNSDTGGDSIFILGGSVGTEIVTFNETAMNPLISGNDRVEVSGGTIGGGVRFGQGTDNFAWLGGGTIGASVLMGAGNDTARLADLTEANFTGVPTIDGGSGVNGNNGLADDTLIFEGTDSSTVSRYVNWETVDLTAGSAITLDGDFVLGDAVSGTGSFSIDATSTLFAGDGANASVRSFTPGLAATLSNAGSIDLTNGAPSAADTFTVAGNYIGLGGILVLDTVVAGDGAPSDRLVIENGTATGSTGIVIVNFGGPGALTTQDGILVVDAVNSTTEAGAFQLASPVAFGAYEYLLFRGGVSAGSEEDWFLRSTLVEPETPPGEEIPLLRPETAVYSALPPAARELALSTLGTFHERRGEQDLLAGGENLSVSWGRLFGKSVEQGFAGTVSPSTDGALGGLQAGQDLLRTESASGGRNVAGLFVGYSALGADVRGAVLGESDADAGRLDLDAFSFGGYFTHIGASGWYVDGVLMGSWFGGDAASDRGIGIDADGEVLTASLEAGVPFAIADGWTLEPQAQIVWQGVSFDDADDGLSTVAFDEGRAVTGRLGARLQGAFDTAAGQIKPYLKANIWHGFDDEDVTRFGDDAIVVETGGTALELGGGVGHAFSQQVSGFVAADYTFDIDGEKRRDFEGNVGLQVKW